MRRRIQLVVPMSGQGKRFQAAGYSMPKPMIPVSGRPMISRLLECIPQTWPATFVLAENHRFSGLPELLKRECSGATIRFVPPHTLGPGHAVHEALPFLSPNDPVFVSYCDFGMIWDSEKFERFVQESNCDACVVSYRGFHAHYLSPGQYAYCRMEGERVVEVREKGSFTNNREKEFASTGGYYFRSAKLLSEALEYQRIKDLSLNGELYVSLTVEALLQMAPSARVRVFEIPLFLQWGTPNDLQAYDYWHKTFNAYYRINPSDNQVDQVLMLMAGRGSRFSSHAGTPKPLVLIEGQPMFQWALSSLPRSDHRLLVALDAFRLSVKPFIDIHTELVTLPETPLGQALTTETGLKILQPEKEVLISACDHSILLALQTWRKFKEQNWDAGIFTIKGYPGTCRTPNAYAYVDCDPDSPERVKTVSVKEPVADDPARSDLLVGTFWFRSVALALDAIRELKERDLRVNGEFYLDSVFSILIQRGMRVGNIPLEGYLGWGDPQSVMEALYWKEVFRPEAALAKTGS